MKLTIMGISYSFPINLCHPLNNLIVLLVVSILLDMFTVMKIVYNENRVIWGNTIHFQLVSGRKKQQVISQEGSMWDIFSKCRLFCFLLHRFFDWFTYNICTWKWKDVTNSLSLPFLTSSTISVHNIIPSNSITLFIKFSYFNVDLSLF